MCHHKLERFAENLTFPNLFQVSYEMLKEEGVENVKLSIVDRGALECTLRARLETLIGRAREEAAHA